MLRRKEVSTLLMAATKPNKIRTEEGPSYWAINENDKNIFGGDIQTKDRWIF